MAQIGSTPSGVLLCNSEDDLGIAKEQVLLTGLAVCGKSFAEAATAARATKQAKGKIKKKQPATAVRVDAFEDPSCIAFAKGLPKDMTDHDLLQCLHSLGCHAASVVLPASEKGRHMNRGFGFVVCQSSVQVQEAATKSPFLIEGHSVVLREYQQPSSCGQQE